MNSVSDYVNRQEKMKEGLLKAIEEKNMEELTSILDAILFSISQSDETIKNLPPIIFANPETEWKLVSGFDKVIEAGYELTKSTGFDEGRVLLKSYIEDINDLRKENPVLEYNININVV